MKSEACADDLMTVIDVARAGDVAPDTVRYWHRHNKLPALRTLGGLRLFRRGDVDRFLAQRGRRLLAR